jgi:HK97 family phage portal protein
MDFRGALQALFGRTGNRAATAWREVGSYNSIFSPYGGEIYANETCRACIRTLAEHTSKANPRCKDDPKLEKMLQYRPNLYMNGKDFLYKVRTRLEIDNTAFIFINRDDKGQVISLYPLPTAQTEAIESDGRLYIKFTWGGTGQSLTAAWADLAVLRKDYNSSDIHGDSNSAISTSLDLMDTTAQGMANAIKSTANIKGLLKFTKGMVKSDDIAKAKDLFVADYMAMTNTSGIVATDSSMEYVPLKAEPLIADYKNIEELRLNIYRYFGVSEDAIQSKLFGDSWEAFYSAQIEPFLIALGLELTRKIYTDRELSFGNEITFESNRMQHMSMESKLKLVQLVDRKTMLPNELRAIMNLPPVPWGDEPLFWQDPKGESNDDPAPEEPGKEEPRKDAESKQGGDVM